MKEEKESYSIRTCSVAMAIRNFKIGLKSKQIHLDNLSFSKKILQTNRLFDRHVW